MICAVFVEGTISECIKAGSVLPSFAGGGSFALGPRGIFHRLLVTFRFQTLQLDHFVYLDVVLVKESNAIVISQMLDGDNRSQF